MSELHLHLKLYKRSACIDEVSLRLGTNFKLVTSSREPTKFELQAISDLTESKDSLQVEGKSGKVYFSHLVETFGSRVKSGNNYISLDGLGSVATGSLPSGFMKNNILEVYWAVRSEKPYTQRKEKSKLSGFGMIKEFFRPLLGHSK